MREGLREIAEQAFGAGVVLFRKQANVVPQTQQMFEQATRLGDTANHGVGVREPEAARQERALALRETIIGRSGIVSPQEPVTEQPSLDRGHRPNESRVGGRQKTDGRKQKQARVEFLCSVRLNEAADSGVEAADANLVVQLIP